MLHVILQRSKSYVMPLALLIVTWVVIASTTPSFKGEASVFSVLEGFPLLGLVALGLAVTIIAGELDLSVGSMAAVAGVVAVKCGSTGLVGAIVIATTVGIVLGAMQGFLIARLGINSLVLTVGTLILLRGVAYLASSNKPSQLENFTISDPLLNRYGIFSISSIVAIAVLVLVGAVLAYTRYGREIYAVGGGRDEARAAGVPRFRPLVLTFALSGACAALAGALASLKGGSAAPQNYDDVLLAGCAAALVGGVSLYGGRGTILHVALGVGTLSVVAAGLAARGSDESLTQLVTGALLIVVVAIEYTAARLRQRSRLKQAAAERTAIPQPQRA